jgi:glycosyltransferase involved in cell wall biosynthesis
MAHHLFGKTAFQAASVPVAIVTFLLEWVIPLFYREIRTIAVSESTRSDLVRRGFRAENVEVIPNGVDLSFYTPQLGSKTVRPTLLFLGRLQRYKRVDLIIEAIANLAVEGVHVHLSIAGAGEQASSLSKLANRLGVDDRVELLGFVTEQMKLDLLRSSWLHVLPSSKEGWGISVIEAAACGTLSVASDAPGLRESVIHEETGLLVRHGDAEALTGAIASLVLDSERRRWMSESARRFAEGYSWDTSAVRVEAVLTQVADFSG